MLRLTLSQKDNYTIEKNPDLIMNANKQPKITDDGFDIFVHPCIFTITNITTVKLPVKKDGIKLYDIQIEKYINVGKKLKKIKLDL